jgi:hypothetical protein
MSMAKSDDKIRIRFSIHRRRWLLTGMSCMPVLQEQKQVIVFTGMSINSAQVTATYTAVNNMVIRSVFYSDKLFSR